MTWEQKYVKAMTLMTEDKTVEADELFEEAADEALTKNNPLCKHVFRSAILTKSAMSYINEGLLEQGILSVQEILDDLIKPIKWTYALIDLENGQLYQNDVKAMTRIWELWGKCCYLKGVDCVDDLQTAINHGSNKAKLYMAYVYYDKAKEVAGSIDTSSYAAFARQFNNTKEALKRANSIQEECGEYFRNIAELLDSYISNYSPVGSSKEELPNACRMAAKVYESGIGVPVDIKKAKMYLGMIDE